MIWVIAVALIALLLLVMLFEVFKVDEGQQFVVLRIGKYNRKADPGRYHLLLRGVEKYIRFDMTQQKVKLNPQEVMTKDNVALHIQGAVFFTIIDTLTTVQNVPNYGRKADVTALIEQLGETTMKKQIGERGLDDAFTQRGELARALKEAMTEWADKWGVRIDLAELEDIRPPEALQEAFAAIPTAERHAKAKLIDAEGELNANRILQQAADELGEGGMRLRELQTMQLIAGEDNTTIIISPTGDAGLTARVAAGSAAGRGAPARKKRTTTKPPEDSSE